MDESLIKELGGVVDGKSKRKSYVWLHDGTIFVRWTPQCGDLHEQLSVGGHVICYAPGLVRLKMILVALGIN